jgi:hypothetical protein
LGETVTESIIGILHNVGGYTYDTIYDLVFTSERVIAVNIKHPADTKLYQEFNLNSFIFGSWGSKFKKQSERLRIYEERRQAITKLTPDELLKLSDHNFEIKYNDIVSVKIHPALLETRLRFILESSGQIKRQRDFMIEKQLIQETRQLLEKVMRSKIKE